MSKINLLNRNLNISVYEKIILENVKKFVHKELIHNANKDFRLKGENTRKIYKKLGNMGILGPTLPNEYGCMNMSYKMYGLIAKEIEYADSGYRSMYSVQSSLVMNPIYKYGNEVLKSKYLASLASGDYIGCFGLTEADSGSDASSMKTTAIADGDYYILNGSKTWITNSPIADVLLVWAKLEDKTCGFVMDRHCKGIETPKIDTKMSLNASETGMIFMNDVKIPKENKLDIEGMKGPLSCLNDARLGISFGVLGAAQFCIEQSLEYAKNRVLFDTLLAEKQLYQKKMADMVTEYNLAFNAALTVSNMVDSKESIPEMISLIKRNNCQKALDIARTSRDILGGNGITEEYNIFRHMINLETVNTYEGTNDIHSLILGKYITDYKAF